MHTCDLCIQNRRLSAKAHGTNSHFVGFFRQPFFAFCDRLVFPWLSRVLVAYDFGLDSGDHAVIMLEYKDRFGSEGAGRRVRLRGFFVHARAGGDLCALSASAARGTP